MRARLYEPSGSHARAALLTSGLHASGIDEPRLVRLAQQLAASHIAVVTPDIPELSRFEIAPAITDAIEDAGGWLASDATLAPDHTAALMGISFSGGLSIVAAGRPSLRGRVAYVFSLGGHDDLPRVLRYLCTGHEPRPMPDVQLGSAARDADFVLPPHDYGVAVILLSLADRLVPAAQVQRLREGVRQYLWASALDGGVDQARAPAEFESVRKLQKTLPEPSATLLRYVLERDVVHLGARLLPLIGVERGRRRPVGLEVAEADGAGVSPARPRRQRGPRGRIGVPRRRSARPRAGAAPAQRPDLARGGRPADARDRRAAARGVLGGFAVTLNHERHESSTRRHEKHETGNKAKIQRSFSCVSCRLIREFRGYR